MRGVFGAAFLAGDGLAEAGLVGEVGAEVPPPPFSSANLVSFFLMAAMELAVERGLEWPAREASLG